MKRKFSLLAMLALAVALLANTHVLAQTKPAAPSTAKTAASTGNLLDINTASLDQLYEGANFWKHDGYYYLLVSAATCCNGPLSGYSVRVGTRAIAAGAVSRQERCITEHIRNRRHI
jgi:beta-xylosidase